MTERVSPNPYSPYANADPTVRHLVPSLFGCDPRPGGLVTAACGPMVVVREGPLGDATDALAEGRLDDLPDGLCRSCVLAATSWGGIERPTVTQQCAECGGQSSQGEWCALCRQDLHDEWWPTREQTSADPAHTTARHTRRT